MNAIKAGLSATPLNCSADNKTKQARFILVCEDDVFFRDRCGMTLSNALQTARRALLTDTTDVVGIGGVSIVERVYALHTRRLVHSIHGCGNCTGVQESQVELRSLLHC